MPQKTTKELLNDITAEMAYRDIILTELKEEIKLLRTSLEFLQNVIMSAQKDMSPVFNPDFVMSIEREMNSAFNTETSIPVQQNQKEKNGGCKCGCGGSKGPQTRAFSPEASVGRRRQREEE